MPEWYDEGGALNIKSGAELLKFDLGTLAINHRRYTILTGYEGTGRCFWCGGELKGKLKRYCRGHMKEYYNHFEWQSASAWCRRRQDWLCANCGKQTSLEVHHVVPLNGGDRYFSVFNLPWNLIGLCHEGKVHSCQRVPKDIYCPINRQVRSKNV